MILPNSTCSDGACCVGNSAREGTEVMVLVAWATVPVAVLEGLVLVAWAAVPEPGLVEMVLVAWAAAPGPGLAELVLVT